VLTVLIDDLGYWDSSVYNNRSVTPVLRSLADDGVRLPRMYTYKYCSPTRRSFLSGRFPVHLSGAQAPVCSDYLPLNMTLLSQKLQSAGVTSHFIGKGHLGYVTMDHLPINRGFASHVGYLYGAENYTHGDSHMNRYWTTDFWHDDHPGSDVVKSVFYSTNYYTSRAVAIIKNFSSVSAERTRRRTVAAAAAAAGSAAHSDTSGDAIRRQPPQEEEALWVHLAHQAVHSPIVDVPQWERIGRQAPLDFWDGVYADMLHVLDDSVHNITETLKAESLWEETLLIVQSDNGGVGSQGNNFPLRGAKMTPWEGGTRVMAFVGGGWSGLPAEARGGTVDTFFHIADWYLLVLSSIWIPHRGTVAIDSRKSLPPKSPLESCP
jgi:arylsulfatase B